MAEESDGPTIRLADNTRRDSGFPEPAFPDVFERETSDGIRLKFLRHTTAPNGNFWDIKVGRLYIGYFCLPPYSALWHVTVDVSGMKHCHRGTFKTPEEGLLNIVETIENLD